MADKITRLPSDLERRKRDEENYSWFIHGCKNTEVWIRNDLSIVCTKCAEKVGECTSFLQTGSLPGHMGKLVSKLFYLCSGQRIGKGCECGVNWFFLRGDGAVVCTKCRKVIGSYELDDD